MQYRIESIAGWKNPAIIRVKDGVVVGHVYAEHADELKPYLGQGKYYSTRINNNA